MKRNPGNRSRSNLRQTFRTALAISLALPGFAVANSDQQVFEKLISQIREVYEPVFASNGMELDIQKADWESNEPNAYVKTETRRGKRFAVIVVNGGLFRMRNMTPDAFTLALCHEIGHALGGAPLVQKRLSSEGQADYFATLKCTRRLWREDSAAVDTRFVPDHLLESCGSQHADPEDALACKRALAAIQAFGMIQVRRYGIDGRSSLTSSSARVASKTIFGYPDNQCRIDTMVAGALCARDEPLSNLDPIAGACAAERGDTVGSRPRCWYRPLTSRELSYIQSKDPGMLQRSLLHDRAD